MEPFSDWKFLGSKMILLCVLRQIMGAGGTLALTGKLAFILTFLLNNLSSSSFAFNKHLYAFYKYMTI